MSDVKVAETEFKEKTHEEIMVIMVALMLAMLLAALDQTIVATALPRIATDLHGLNKYAWVATAYLLTSAVSTPIYGKISDQFGRKKIFQFAIVVFLVGSALSGQARTMNELVGFRALQGLGAGGLITLSQTIIGDIVSPRQRGKYLAYIGSMFALASVAGPLLGGFFTDDLSWRWIFYVNLPIGILALFAISARLHLPVKNIKRKIDYFGAFLLSLWTVPLILGTVLGGVTYPWSSATIISLFGGSVIAWILFTIWETKYASEPIIPTSLFKNRIFTVSVILSLLSGIAFFAAILFIPEYQQLVRGYSATKSGLLILPLVVGMLTGLIGSGRLISKYGKYKIFPIVGTLIATLGLWLFTHISLTTPQIDLSLWMVVVGLGIGSFLQVITLAVQNSVPRSELGVATASSTFFRSMGSALGGAIFGAILTSKFAHNLKAALPKGAHVQISSKSIETGAVSNLHKLPKSISHPVLQAFSTSFKDMFAYAIPVMILAFIVALFLKQIPLRTTTRDAEEI